MVHRALVLPVGAAALLAMVMESGLVMNATVSCDLSQVAAVTSSWRQRPISRMDRR